MIFLRMAGLTGAVREHWKKTIEKKINLNEIEQFLNKKDFFALRQFGESLNFWGDADRTLVRTERIIDNSQIIFYGQKKHHTLVDVPYTFINEELSEYLWPRKKKTDQLYRNMYLVQNIQKIHIPFFSQDYKTKDGENYSKNADKFMGGGLLKDFNDFKENDPDKGTIWYLNDELRKIDNRIQTDFTHPESDSYNYKGLKRNTPIPKAWIYQISYELDGKKMKYVGQENVFNKDNKFEDSKYKSSSLVFWHTRKILGLLDATLEELEEKLNYKKLKLFELVDTTKGDVNDKENELIEEMYEESKEKDFMPINYTGSNSPKYK